MTGDPSHIKRRIELIYSKIPYQVFNGLYCFLMIIFVGAVLFTGLQIEELVLGCTGNTTFLQWLKLPMEFDGVCSDDEFMKMSYITIFASGLYAFCMLFLMQTIRQEGLRRVKN